ncbi:hypothetical protein [Bradyrhizobium sp.]|uniref:hypothetical protein n=1 Tax=Bradyrhizobium sp. TaxID=376 RepID=UPI003C74AACB
MTVTVLIAISFWCGIGTRRANNVNGQIAWLAFRATSMKLRTSARWCGRTPRRAVLVNPGEQFEFLPLLDVKGRQLAERPVQPWCKVMQRSRTGEPAGDVALFAAVEASHPLDSRGGGLEQIAR